MYYLMGCFAVDNLGRNDHKSNTLHKVLDTCHEDTGNHEAGGTCHAETSTHSEKTNNPEEQRQL